MNRRRMFSATYRDGAFHPDEPCDLPEGTRVTVGESLNGVYPPLEPDPAERRRIAREIAQDMLNNPLHFSGEKLTREQMHERRP